MVVESCLDLLISNSNGLTQRRRTTTGSRRGAEEWERRWGQRNFLTQGSQGSQGFRAASVCDRWLLCVSFFLFLF